MRHPAHFFIKYLILREPSITDAGIQLELQNRSFLSPEDAYLGFLRQEVADRPVGFEPADRLHRPSVRYLRDQQVYELFFPSSAVEEAWGILAEHPQRECAEQIILSRINPRIALLKVNQKKGWHLTESGLETFRHYFWNVNLLSFDEWGRYLYNRSAMYDRYMALLHAPQELANFHLRIDQSLESKKMIQRAQEIAFFALEEVSLVPGVRPDKVKAISMLTKAINDCHQSLSTSDMALAGVLDQFNKFRMTHSEPNPPSILQLAPSGNFSGSGQEEREKAALFNRGD